MFATWAIKKLECLSQVAGAAYCSNPTSLTKMIEFYQIFLPPLSCPFQEITNADNCVAPHTDSR